MGAAYGGKLDIGEVPSPPTIKTAGLSSAGADVAGWASGLTPSAIAAQMLEVSGFSTRQ